MQVDINTILEDLKSGKASRTQDSLDKLNALLEARFNAPTGIAIDPNNNKVLYVSDSKNHVIRKITVE